MKSIIFGVVFVCLLRYGRAILPEDIVPKGGGDTAKVLRDVSGATVAPGLKQIDKCIMETKQGQINLWPIGSKDNSPRWPYHQTVNNVQDPNFYSYDPCYDFTQGNCKNSYVCLSNVLKQNDTSIGLQEGKFIFNEQSTDYLIQYIGGHQQIGEPPVITNVKLTCIEANLQDSIEVVGNISKGLYLIELKSHCCCPGACSSDVSKKLSFGSILCIIFVCLMFVYFVGGMIYMKVVRGARGTEIIPNVGFWMDLPNLIMDGVTFVFSCGKATTSPGYDNI